MQKRTNKKQPLNFALLHEGDKIHKGDIIVVSITTGFSIDFIVTSVTKDHAFSRLSGDGKLYRFGRHYSLKGLKVPRSENDTCMYYVLRYY